MTMGSGRTTACFAIVVLVVISSCQHSSAQRSYGEMFGHGDDHFRYNHDHGKHLGPGWHSDSRKWDHQGYKPWDHRGHHHHSCCPKRRWHLVVNTTNDGPALVGSQITFTAHVERVWSRGNWLGNNTNSVSQGWSEGGAFGNWNVTDMKESDFNCEAIGGMNASIRGYYGTLPSDRPASFGQPRPKCRPFIYIWYTQGHYFNVVDSRTSTVTINTTDIPVGKQSMQLLVLWQLRPRLLKLLTNQTTNYIITDKVPFIVKLSQTGDRRADDNIFMVNKSVVFDVILHDPSNYLQNANITYFWDFGDGTRRVENTSITNHSYSTLGSFMPSLFLEAIIPTQCGVLNATILPLTDFFDDSADEPDMFGSLASNMTTTMSTPPMPTTPAPHCQVIRYGNDSITMNIVGAVSSVEVVEAIQVSAPDGQAMDLTISCQGSLPNEICTIVADESCSMTQAITCGPPALTEACHLTFRQTFNSSGVFCLNVSLSNGVSLAVTSKRVAVLPRQTRRFGTIVVIMLGLAIPCIFLGLTWYMHKYRSWHGLALAPRAATFTKQSFPKLWFGGTEGKPLLPNKM
uniref:protein QNR-71-like n=1 Tax=Myxine glutinosa TaxID=7769 RepID=UPI00358FC3B0